MERVVQVRPLLCSMLGLPSTKCTCSNPFLYIHAGDDEKAAQRAAAAAVVKDAIDRAVVRVSREGSSVGESGAGETITL